MATKGRTDFIFQRGGRWWVKLRSGGKRIERSLGTSERALADVLAAPLIAEHKARLLESRPRIEPTWRHDLKPGLHVGPDGGRIFATDRELHHLDDQGTTIRTTINGGPAFQITRIPRLGLNLPIPIDVNEDAARPILAVKNSDDALLEIYLKHASISGYYEREARSVWALYKQLTDSKPLKDATRDDGRKLVAHFEDQGLKSATIGKKVGWLTAAVNLAIKEGRLKFNPFASVVPRRDDSQRRLPLAEADIKIIKRNLGRLDKSDQLLFRLLATTGMRLSEAFEIEAESIERGVRFVICGRKTEQSLRRVPLPAGVLPYLPKTIKGPLFASDHVDPADAASKRLNRFLNDIGITDRAKVVHSLRHRAQDRLRAAECPQDVRWALLGHEEPTVAAGYGEGFSVPLLRRWIDKIGF